MYKIFSFALFVFCSFSPAFGQGIVVNNYDIHAGIAFPSSPEKFYDYWQNGVVIGGGIELMISDASSIVVSADYARFTLDKGRFFKGIKLQEEGNTISGAVTNIVTATGFYKYFPPSQVVPLYALCGAAVNVSSISRTSATYTNYTTSMESKSHVAFSLALGAGISFKLNQNMDLYFEGKYFLGILKSADANAVFNPVTTGVRMGL